MSRVNDPAHLFVYQIDNPTLHQVIYTLFFLTLGITLCLFSSLFVNMDNINLKKKKFFFYIRLNL